jgi:hypothetical protein
VIDCKVALVTVKVVVPDYPLNLAVIAVAPTLAPLVRPSLPVALLTFAIVGSADTQLAVAVTSFVVRFLLLTVACNSTQVPTATVGLAGSMVID